MGRILELSFSFIFTTLIYLCTGQDLPQEQLRTVTTCSLNSVNITCTNDEIIAVHSLYFWYHATCESICCDPDNSHYLAGADNSAAMSLRRACSGQSSCTLDLSGIRNFDSAGLKNPSYVVVHHYCVTASRTMSICSDFGQTSTGTPLYLTSKDPSVTTGDDSTCSCSLEVESCTSGVNFYLIDTDLYYDTSHCEQNLIFYDGRDAPVKEFKCENYYTNNIATFSLNTSYVKISFIDNSTSNQEGYFFFGIVASEINSQFKLSCTAVTQTKCFDCGIPENIPYGRIALSDTSSTGYGALADVKCFDGYKTDTSNISCLETGQWENATCSPKDCGQPYTIANGTITTLISGVTTFGAKANVTCDIGYEVKGYCDIDSQFQCGDGSCISLSKKCDNFEDCLDSLDESTDVCGRTVCLEDQKLCNGLCVDKSTDCIDSGTNDSPTEADTVSCLAIGKWEKIRCVIKDCGNAPEILNGYVTLTREGQTTYGSTAAVDCEIGFTPSNISITCKADRQWETATCVINDCGNAPEISNGYVTLTTEGQTTYGSTAAVDCETGFTLSNISITCQADRQWETATCVINDCSLPYDIVNGTIILTANRTTYGSTANVACETGFSSSVEFITCWANSTWSLATCNINDCGNAPWISNGYVTLTIEGQTTYGSSAAVDCETGFTPSNKSITCQADRQWEIATCVINDCGFPYDVVNGTIILTDNRTTYGSTANITCETGLSSSVEFITCWANSTWSLAICNINNCGSPPSLANGRIKLLKEGETRFVSTVDVNCDTGFSPFPESVTCLANGSWEYAFCGINDCRTPGSIKDGILNLTTSDKTTYSSTATVNCEVGFTPSVTTVMCQANKYWENATCEINDCGHVALIENGTITLTKHNTSTYQSTANVICDPGFNAPATVISCLADGSWEHGECEIIDCGTPGSIKDGTLKLTISDKTMYRSTAKVYCEVGFTPSVTTVMCQANKQWGNATCEIKDDDDDVKIVTLVSIFGALVLITIIVLALILIRRKAKSKEASYINTQENGRSSQASHNQAHIHRMNSFQVDPSSENYDYILENGGQVSVPDDPPMQEHRMSPNELNRLEESTYEPLRMHTDMSSHSGRSEFEYEHINNLSN